ncbi:MAG TPA: hypothetical protein DDW87_04785 [Firmicutes bacterium]|nr:hypothetical protein [Bacillota bacterium]
MARKSLLVVLGLVVALACSSLVFAQEYWEFNKFTADKESFKYEITSYSEQWDYELGEDVLRETRQTQTLGLRRVDDYTTEVTVGYTSDVPTSGLGEQLSLLAMGMGMSLPTGGEWLGELMSLTLFAVEMELEEGSNIQMFDGSRFRVVEKRTVAGVEGYYCTKSTREQDEAGNRVDKLTSEWILAPGVGWPLLVRVYNDGEVTYVMELVEYSRD